VGAIPERNRGGSARKNGFGGRGKEKDKRDRDSGPNRKKAHSQKALAGKKDGEKRTRKELGPKKGIGRKKSERDCHDTVKVISETGGGQNPSTHRSPTEREVEQKDGEC